MTFHCIPAIWTQDYGMMISETFAVTLQGPEVFAHFPRELLCET
ncbi:hypothetical protein [Bradyrhizobium sp. ISRA442]